MAYKTEHITQQLRAAREGQKVSQRELSARSGLTQSHISQIERGTMEPGLGSLVDVARALDLEIVLAPKKLMPAIRNILDSSSTSNDVLTSDQRKLVARLERWLAQFGYGAGTRADADIFKDSLALLRHLPLTPDELGMLKRAADRLETSRADKMSRQEMGAIAREIRQLRNAAVHRDRDDAVPRSAYALDEDDDA
ncbi:helix-turn-helix domain-containing protein [Neorhizobium sp. T25_13]|uniref:helix-turn-helix domain-containing protein n=1 Tax=Neorhizobium sp. T25_13 TaxID=2093830 RepID=UPI000CF89A55|nr:helix-turn-helix transcriptional regulator [Neorhizobium sp. T25_13]